MTRDERQKQAIQKWIANKGQGTIVGCTSFGKTYCAIRLIRALGEKYPNLDTLILVPTDALRQQWKDLLTKHNLHARVEIMMGASQRETYCDLLVLDECHRASAQKISNIFNVVKYKMILGLTATFERLDGRDAILAKYAPVVDTITLAEASLNGWISKYTDYVVLIEPSDLEEYARLNADFHECFSFFGFNFPLVMSLVGKKGFEAKKAYTSQICKNPDEWKDTLRNVTYYSVRFMQLLQRRKKYIATHPDKLRVAQRIIEKRPNSKIITFSSSVAIAESFGNGYVYTGKEGKKKNRMSLDEFATQPTGILHSCQLLNEGVSIPSVDVGIMLALNSSKTKAAQTLGRCLRLNGDTKHAEFFNLVLNHTVECEWLRKSRNDSNYVVIDEENLEKVLDYQPYSQYQYRLPSYLFRY